MARTWYVNGEASIASNIGGGLEELGISVDGVSITTHQFDDGIQVDTFGPHVYGEYQYFLQDIEIRAELVYFDITVIQKWLTGLPDSATSFGEFGAAGSLLIDGDNTGRLLVRSTPNGTGLTGQAECYNFPYAYLIDAQETKLGTVRSTWTLTWKAIGPYQPSTSEGVVLFNSTCD